MGELWRRFWYLLRREREQRDLHEEMEGHRAMMSEPRQFGNTLRLREESQEVWLWPRLEQFFQDLRFGWRSLCKSPGFTITAVLTLSFGIGLNLTFFQFVNANLLKPPAIRDPHTFAIFYSLGSYLEGGSSRSSQVDYRAVEYVREHNTVLSAVVAENARLVTWGDEDTKQVGARYVTTNYFTQMGYDASLGRVFAERIDGPASSAPVVVLSHDFWQARLGADPNVIGGSVRVNGLPATVIGIAPERFRTPRGRRTQIWLLLNQWSYYQHGMTEIGGVQMFGRLRPGVSPENAREGLKPAFQEWNRQHPREAGPDQVWLEPYLATARFHPPRERRQIWMMIAPVAALTLLVLLVACANLGNLVLSRASGRVRELGLRAALGAGRWRVVRQLVTEQTVLALLGATGGLALGYSAAAILATVMETGTPMDHLPDWRTALAAAILGALSIVAFALIPSWKVCQQDLLGVIKDGGLQSSTSMARSRLRQVLVAAQVMGSCVVLVVAGLMVDKLQKLLRQGPGFAFERVAVLEAEPHSHGIEGAAARAWWLEVRQAVASHPENEGAVFSNLAPLGNRVSISSWEEAPGVRVTPIAVEPEFFALLRIPIVEGRNFLPDDDPQATVIVSRRLARTMFGTISAIGKPFPGGRIIVGVAGEAKIIEPYATDTTAMYTPLPRDLSGRLTLLAVALENPEPLLPVIRSAAGRADTRVLPQIHLMSDGFEETVKGPRTMSSIAGATGGLTLLLACLGIFGLVSFWVTQRTREIGIRVALGARGVTIVSLVLRQLSLPLGFGALAGLAASFAAGRVLAGDPFYLDPSFNIAHLGAVFILAATSALAALLPARRALRVDPVRALRHE